MHFVVFHIPTVDRQYVLIGAHVTLLLFFSEGGIVDCGSAVLRQLAMQLKGSSEKDVKQLVKNIMHCAICVLLWPSLVTCSQIFESWL